MWFFCIFLGFYVCRGRFWIRLDIGSFALKEMVHFRRLNLACLGTSRFREANGLADDRFVRLEFFDALKPRLVRERIGWLLGIRCVMLSTGCVFEICEERRWGAISLVLCLGVMIVVGIACLGLNILVSGAAGRLVAFNFKLRCP